MLLGRCIYNFSSFIYFIPSLYRSITEEGTPNQSTPISGSVPSIELSTVATPEADEDQKDATISEDDSWIVHIENAEVAGELYHKKIFWWRVDIYLRYFQLKKSELFI